MTFSKLVSEGNLEFKVEKKPLYRIGDEEKKEPFLEIAQYLPIDEKIKLIEFIVNGAIDETTGTFSPIRVEVFYGIAICKWYADIKFSEKQLQDIGHTYDILESNNIIGMILSAIPKDENVFIRSLVNDTISDISRYNSSAAGIIQAMSGNAGDLEEQISTILKDIQDGKGLEQLKVIKDVVGND